MIDLIINPVIASIFYPKAIEAFSLMINFYLANMRNLSVSQQGITPPYASHIYLGEAEAKSCMALKKNQNAVKQVLLVGAHCHPLGGVFVSEANYCKTFFLVVYVPVIKSILKILTDCDDGAKIVTRKRGGH